MWQNPRTQVVTKLKNSNCDKTQQLKLWKNSKSSNTDTSTTDGIFSGQHLQFLRLFFKKYIPHISLVIVLNVFSTWIITKIKLAEWYLLNNFQDELNPRKHLQKMHAFFIIRRKVFPILDNFYKILGWKKWVVFPVVPFTPNLYTRLDNLALSLSVFWQLGFCKEFRFLKPLLLFSFHSFCSFT